MNSDPGSRSASPFGPIVPLLPVVVMAAYAMTLLAFVGTSIGQSLTYAAYLFFVILVPGRLVWIWLLGKVVNDDQRVIRNRLEEWVCGAAAGYALELVCYVVARWAGVPRLYVVGPAAIAAILGLSAKKRLRIPSRVPFSPALSWSYAALVAYLITWLWASTMRPRPLVPYQPTDIDEPFQLALVGELRHHFPPEYPYVEAGSLTYQWFVHAHMAASSWITGLEPVLLYRRIDPLVFAVLAVLGAGVVASRLAERAWPGWIAGAIMVLVGAFDVTGATVGQATPEERFLEAGILLNSPTQAFAFALSPAVMLLCLEMLRRGPSWHLSIATAFGMALLCGSKVTFVPLFFAGFLLVGAVLVWRHRAVPVRASLGMVLSLGTLGLSSVLLYRGDSHSLALEPGATSRFFASSLGLGGGGLIGESVVAMSLVAMWLVPSAGALGLAKQGRRWDPRVWWLLGFIGGGLAALFLLNHAGRSQLYFGRSVAPALAILGAWGISELFPNGTRRRSITVGLIVAIGGGVALALTRWLTESWRMPSTDGGSSSAPVLRIWVNLAVLAGLLVVAFSASLLIRDMSHRRHRLSIRLVIAFLCGLGLARPIAFATGHTPPVDPRAFEHLRLAPGAVESARWLRSHSAPDERVITNAHCISGSVNHECDARHFWMSALSERRFLLEGWSYTRHQEQMLAPFWGRRQFLNRNDRLFQEPTRNRLADFLTMHKASWMLIDRRLSVDMEALDGLPRVDMRFASGDFAVFRIE